MLVAHSMRDTITCNLLRHGIQSIVYRSSHDILENYTLRWMDMRGCCNPKKKTVLHVTYNVHFMYYNDRLDYKVLKKRVKEEHEV